MIHGTTAQQSRRPARTRRATPAARVPQPESWKPYGNRIYNTYRSQPRAYGVAPDLSLIEMQVSSPDVACGQLSNLLEIVVLVKNLGDLRVGPGVALTFSGDFGGSTAALNGEDMPLRSILTTSLEPGASLLVTVRFRAQDNTQNVLPSKVIAVIDEANKERECKEDNNRIEQKVAAGEQLADLKLELGAVINMCSPNTTVAAKVTNTGSLEAKDVLVRLFAGDPSAGDRREDDRRGDRTGPQRDHRRARGKRGPQHHDLGHRGSPRCDQGVQQRE